MESAGILSWVEDSSRNVNCTKISLPSLVTDGKQLIHIREWQGNPIYCEDPNLIQFIFKEHPTPSKTIQTESHEHYKQEKLDNQIYIPQQQKKLN